MCGHRSGWPQTPRLQTDRLTLNISAASIPLDPANGAIQAIHDAFRTWDQAAKIGMTEGEARNRLGQVRTYTSDFRPMKNVLAGRNERSLYKLVVDGATDRVVGIHMIGPDAPEILQAAAIAVKAGLKKADFDATVALHPTMSEELVLMR